MNRPDPHSFAIYGYYMAFVTAIIVTLALVFGFIHPLRMLSNVIWLALITSAMGTFMAYAARRDFTRIKQVDPEIERKARVAWRINLMMLVLMVFISIFTIVLQVMRFN